MGKALRHIAKTKGALRWAWAYVGLLFAVALFADVLAGDKPLYIKLEGESYFPIGQYYAQALGFGPMDPRFLHGRWESLSPQALVLPLIPYGPTQTDLRHSRFVSPFARQQVESWRYRHWLGTDKLGRDVAAGLIHGTRVALSVALIAMGIAALLGLLAGTLAGYFGDQGLRWHPWRLWGTGLNVLLAFFVCVAARSVFWGKAPLGQWLLSGAAFGLWVWLADVFWKWLAGRWGKGWRSRRVPLDLLIMRGIEILDAIPRLLLLLSVLALLDRPGLGYVMLIIGLLAWTGIARHVRAELLRVRQLPFVEAARALGLPTWRIALRHALPSALDPVLIQVAFGMASAILLEAFLSFLGIGVRPETVTWGSLISASRSAPQAWWMSALPGLAIFFSVLAFNLIGESLSRRV